MATPTTSPSIRECLARVSALLVSTPRASRRALRDAVRPLVRDDVEASWYAHLCAALVRWSDGHVHEALAAALEGWEGRDLRACRPLLIVANRAAEGARVTFATFDLDRLVFALHTTRPGRKRARVFEGDALLAEGDAVGGLVALAEVAFLLRVKKRWRAHHGAARSRTFDRVERGLIHGDTPVYLVRDGARRRVIAGAVDGPPWARVKLPVWGGTMLEAAPEFFVEYEEGGALVYAGEGPRGWVLVRDGVAERHPWERVEDLTVVQGKVCYRGRRRRRWCVVEGDAAGVACDEIPRVSWAGGRAVYRARIGKAWMVVDGDRYRYPYQELTQGEMRGAEPFYAGRDGEAWWVHHGARRWGPYRGVHLLPPPAGDAPDGDERGGASVAYCASRADGSGEAVCVDGREVAAFDAVVEALFTAEGTACAGHRGGVVVVRDVDGAELATVEGLVSLGEAMNHAYLERLDGRTYFIAKEGKRRRLHAGAWRSEAVDEVVPLWLSCRGGAVYGAREGRAWKVRAGAAEAPLKRRPTAAFGPDGATETDGALTVVLSGEKTVDVTL